MRFLDPAFAVRAGPVRAGVIRAALADLPAPVDSDLLRLLGTRRSAAFSRPASIHPAE